MKKLLTRGLSRLHCRGAWAGALFAAAALVSSPVNAQTTTYTASWASVNTHTPAPEWFQDAKFGIYFHWGVYSVPAYGSEWYPRNMYDKAGNTGGVYNHHVNTFGDPFSTWPYNNFIDGAKAKDGTFTQFAPELTSAGGNWDPDAWAKIFVDAGARYAGPSMEHHDGFSMWDSKANPWNSVAHGPKLNLAQLHVTAFRKAGLRIVAALHHAYHFNGYYQWAPAQTDPNLKILFGQQGAAAENDLWLAKLKEVIDEFQPDIVWQDFDLNRVDTTHLLEFLAYYYNAANGWGKDVVATYKDGLNNQGEVYDYERGGPASITTPYWLTDDAVGRDSWCYTSGMSYYTPQAVVDAFIDRVSKGGNLLLNISPMADGTIPQAQQTILSTMGAFLKQSGTAIYNTRAWTVYGEGPTKMGGGSFTAPTAGTASDIRYTKSKDGSTLYAIFMGWPGNGKQATMASVTSSAFPVGTGKVFLFGPTGGSPISLDFTQDGSGLHVTLPGTQPYTAVAYAMAISKSGTPPAPTPWLEPPADGGSTPPPDDAGATDADAGPGMTDASTGVSGSSSGAGQSSGSGGSPSQTSGNGGTSAVATSAGSSAAGAPSAPSSDNSGCSCSLASRSDSAAALASLALALALAASRRRRSPRADSPRA
jgi:alpha-L-fucosidase